MRTARLLTICLLGGRLSECFGVCLLAGGVGGGGLPSTWYCGLWEDLPCGQTDSCENITLPHFRLQAVITYILATMIVVLVFEILTRTNDRGGGIHKGRE